MRRTVSLQVIAFEIVALGTSVKTSKNNVVISDLTRPKDPYKDKIRDTNESLKMLCSSRNISYTSKGYINYRGLRLNFGDSKLAANNSLNAGKSVRLKVILHRCKLACKRK